MATSPDWSLQLNPHTPSSPRAVVQVHRVLLRWRLRRCYMVYSMVLCSLCLLLFGSTVRSLVSLHGKGHRWSDHAFSTWETMLEVGVGVALVIEIFIHCSIVGARVWCQSCVNASDTVFAVLTVASWLMMLSRPRLSGFLDMPLLAIRFILQPCRVVASVVSAWRVERMRREPQSIWSAASSDSDTQMLEWLKDSDILTPVIVKEIESHLPCWARFKQWRLVYSPRLHGISMRTLFRQQEGPNVILARDTEGGVYGGFACVPWELKSGYYGSAESFVFSMPAPSMWTMEVEELSFEAEATTAPQSQLCFHSCCAELGTSTQWSDGVMLGMGSALAIKDDFLAGSSSECTTFGCKGLLPNSGTDFLIQAFECWALCE